MLRLSRARPEDRLAIIMKMSGCDMLQLEGGLDDTGMLSLRWIRRSRSGWAWLDDVDAPLGETAEHYRVVVIGSAGLVEANSTVPSIEICSVELAAVEAGAATVEARQVRDFAASRPATINIILS